MFLITYWVADDAGDEQEEKQKYYKPDFGIKD